MGWRWRIILAVLVVLASTKSAAPQSGHPVAILTEIRPGQGEVRVKAATETDWKLALPLLSLRAGDHIDATGTATAVVMFSGGQGTVTISAANSPYVVQPWSAAAAGGKAAELVAFLSRFLAGKKKELTYIPVTTRSVQQSLLLLSPRDGKLLGLPTFEWGGSDLLRYTVRVFGPQGLVWERPDLPRAPLPYPANTPGLVPDVPYSWELTTPGIPPQRGRFALLSPAEAAESREALMGLGQQGYPKNTAALLRAGFLFERDLFVEAHKELLAAIAADPDEPSLHVMLGQLYERLGLQDLATQEYDEARFRILAAPTRTP
jgi:hypothetical protein